MSDKWSSIGINTIVVMLFITIKSIAIYLTNIGCWHFRCCNQVTIAIILIIHSFTISCSISGPHTFSLKSCPFLFAMLTLPFLKIGSQKNTYKPWFFLIFLMSYFFIRSSISSFSLLESDVSFTLFAKILHK